MFATSYNNIGAVYDSQGRYEEALQEYEKGLKIRLDKLHHEHPEVAISKFNMAILLGNMDKKAESNIQNSSELDGERMQCCKIEVCQLVRK